MEEAQISKITHLCFVYKMINAYFCFVHEIIIHYLCLVDKTETKRYGQKYFENSYC